MAQFTVHDVESAPEGSKEMLRGAEEKFKFIPNLAGVLAEAPPALEAYFAVSGAFEGSSLSPVEQQVVLLAVSFENRCDYCMAAHGTIAGMVDMPEDVLEALRDGRELPDAKLEALRTFTRRVVTERGWVGAAAVQDFLDAGFTKAQVLEVLVGVTQKTLSNYTNHLAHTPVDEAFEGQRWTHPAEREEPASV